MDRYNIEVRSTGGAHLRSIHCTRIFFKIDRRRLLPVASRLARQALAPTDNCRRFATALLA
jgi:hypothetical protein